MAPPVAESHYDLLRDAIFDNNVDRFEELLGGDGVDADHFDAGGQTLLHLASFWGRMPIVKLLLNAGASMKTKNAAGCTALDLATHWGHSSVAEIIRLRGGCSVWEEKMGQLQIRVEDLKLLNAQLTTQLQDKKRQHEELLDEYHGLHKRHEEEKGAHMTTQEQLHHVQQQRDGLAQEKLDLRTQLAEMTEKFRAMAVDKARSDCLRDEAQRELVAAFVHRDEVLLSMQQSVQKQEELTQHWQQAEIAAAIADSKRNFTLGEKEKLQKQHTAALGELLLVTERLHEAEAELMMLRVELAEYIYGKEKDQRVVKRAARVLARREGITSTSDQLRPHTTPAVLATTLTSTPEESHELPGPVLNAKKKAQFSMAAREFGDHLRSKEHKKAQQRQRRQHSVENQYLTHGLSTPVIASDQFQDEFVSTLNAFATTRHHKWADLQRDRESQLAFARNVMGRRAIATSPAVVPVRRPRNSTAGGPESGENTKSSSRSLAPLRRKNSMNFNAYANDESSGDGRGVSGAGGRGGESGGGGAVRPATTAIEQRLKTTFFQERRSSIQKTMDKGEISTAAAPPIVDPHG